MADTDSFIVEMADRMFAALADPQTIILSRSDAWKQRLWPELEQTGLTLAWVPEALGGTGAPMEETFGVLRAAGRAALAAPLAETMLAGWLLAQANIAAPSGPMTVVPATPDAASLTIDSLGRLGGVARKIPFGAEAGHFAVLAQAPDGMAVALVRAADAEVATGFGLGGDPANTVSFTDVVPVRIAAVDLAVGDLMLMGAVARAQQIAGALETMLALSVRYAMDRVAFEKPIAKFQAVQHNLARLGGEVAAAVAVAASAADTISETGVTGEAALLEAASAKIRASEAAETGAAIAHQTHGAIGFTDEHILHRLTLRALGWRDDFGNETWWSVRLGQFVAAGGDQRLWPLLASR